MEVMVATIGKHPERAGVWCVFVPCDTCKEWFYNGDGTVDSLGRPHPACGGTGKRILSTHATRDGAVVSCNQINRAEAGR